MGRRVQRKNAENSEGKVLTPYRVALHMVDKLFKDLPPTSSSRVLDAGCGPGVFIDAIIDWCNAKGLELPEIIGVEIDPKFAEIARRRFKGIDKVRIVEGDFLAMGERDLGGKFDYIISNPPYISYEKIPFNEREKYRKLFKCAVGRFDTYMLFFEKSLELLKTGGKLVFITPEKYLYVISAKPLRKLLSGYFVEEIELLSEDAFEGILAYPAITVLWNRFPEGPTRVKLRNGTVIEVIPPTDGSPWLAAALARLGPPTERNSSDIVKLKDVALRISAGVATGLDEAFVIPKARLPKGLEPYAYPTVSGAELVRFKPGEVIDVRKLSHVILVPYTLEGKLLDEESAKQLISYLARYKTRLEERTAVRVKGKKWFAFHEDPPLKDLLRPKILWPDIAREPFFYVDVEGRIVPRHTVYYLVPKDANMVVELVKYLNSEEVKEWLKAHCQRAANGYLRLQAHILKELPIPEDYISRYKS
jgi:SAM-dependent methyltransferase